MTASKEFMDQIKDRLGSRIKNQESSQNIEVWPDDDDFGRWVAFHQDKVRAVVCATPEYSDSPFCGRGFH